ncbi:unnamed protein product, partial [Ectocarpus sp. 12 AP-2014]
IWYHGVCIYLCRHFYNTSGSTFMIIFILSWTTRATLVTTTSSYTAGFRVQYHRRVHGTRSADEVRNTPLETTGGPRCGSDVSTNNDTATASEGDYQKKHCSGRAPSIRHSRVPSRLRGED